MSAPFPRRDAADLLDATFLAKWAARSALSEILDRFVADAAMIDIATLRHGTAVAELDERDLVYVSDGHLVLAYPWSGTPLGDAFSLDARIFGELLPRLLRAP